MKKFATLLLLAVMTFTLAACGDGFHKPEDSDSPRVVITLTDGRKMTAELYPDVAPETVANFLSLVDKKAYDGVIFHRVIENFMIQTGGYKMTSSSGYDTVKANTIRGEFSANGFENSLKHEPGVLSMARASDYNSASSQFFICVATSTHLDGQYAAFGKLVDSDSYAVAEAISKVQTSYQTPFGNDVPVETITIATIRRAK